MATDIGAPRLEKFGPVVLAGIRRSHSLPQSLEELYWEMAEQWRELAEVAESIPALPPRLGYGVGLHVTDDIPRLDYLCGLVVPSPSRVPEGLDCLEIPLVTCAVFHHTDHVSRLSYTIAMIFGSALTHAGLEPAGPPAPQLIQRYGEEFNPETGFGGFDVLVPVKE